MKRVRRKLNSTRGASLIFALLVFLLCAFAGAAALTAAAANAGRYAHAEHDQQQYLSVASATDLLRGDFSGTKAVFTRELVETREWQYVLTDGAYVLQENTSYTLNDSTVKWYVDGTELQSSDTFLLKTLLGADCRMLFETEAVPADWYEKVSRTRPDATAAYPIKKLTVSGVDELEKKLEQVQVRLSLDPDTYAITVVMGAGDDADALTYETTLRMTAATSYDISSSAVTYGDSTDKGTTVTTTTVTFTMEWDDALVIQN